jgi:membrane-bound serine protease (ClpP class)
MKRVLSGITFLILFLLASAHTFSADGSVVHVIRIDGTINPAVSSIIKEGIEYATAERSECLIVEINTPGGLLKSTRVIVSDILGSDIPVVVYVSPSGSSATSAGVFITLAGHIAAMAPGTNMGAAHPVGMDGQADTVMIEKALNDAAAFIRTIAEQRDRNIEWAEQAVRKSLSVTESEALRNNIIDLIASDLDDLLAQIHNREIETRSGVRTLNTENAEVIVIEMNWQQRFLNILSDPSIAYIFFMVGLAGIMFEIYNPGAIFPGVVGVISLILAFYSLHTLPVNYAGLALIVFAVILFLLEIKVPSYGLLTIGGVVSLLLGSVMLIDPDSALEYARISWTVIIPVTFFITAFFLVAISLGIRAQLRKPTTGSEGIIGSIGEALETLDPTGEVRVLGELWNAQSVKQKIHKGEHIRVIGVEDMILTVEKAEQNERSY